MFRRRRDVNAWSEKLLREQIVACYTTDPDHDEVRAVVVLHQDPELLPKDAPARAEAEAAEREEPYDGLPLFIAFCFGLDEEDRVDVFMGGNIATTVHEYRGFDSPKKAAQYAATWVGEHGVVLPFENIPGLYQAAFFEFITGREAELTALTFMWTLPAVGDYVPVRKFPGDLRDT